jgi:hypothetical protein
MSEEIKSGKMVGVTLAVLLILVMLYDGACYVVAFEAHQRDGESRLLVVGRHKGTCLALLGYYIG